MDQSESSGLNGSKWIEMLCWYSSNKSVVTINTMLQFLDIILIKDMLPT